MAFIEINNPDDLKEIKRLCDEHVESLGKKIEEYRKENFKFFRRAYLATHYPSLSTRRTKWDWFCNRVVNDGHQHWLKNRPSNDDVRKTPQRSGCSYSLYGYVPRYDIGKLKDSLKFYDRISNAIDVVLDTDVKENKFSISEDQLVKIGYLRKC